jgi:hypothetical protein
MLGKDDVVVVVGMGIYCDWKCEWEWEGKYCEEEDDEEAEAEAEGRISRAQVCERWRLPIGFCFIVSMS